MIFLDLKNTDVKTVYKLMIGAIVPRPIAFISTVSPNAITNLAPFSFFNGVSSSPACLSVAITRKPDGSKKDTLINIEKTGEFVVNITTESMVAAVNQASAPYDYEISEFEKTALTPLASRFVKPPRVKQSPIHFECKTYKTVEIGNGEVGSAVLVIGEIVATHIDESVYQEGKILLEQLHPLSRLGGLSYGRTTELCELPRPKVE